MLLSSDAYMNRNPAAENQASRKRWRSITELSCDEARTFLLKGESYCTIELPRYFQFDGLLESVSRVLQGDGLGKSHLRSMRSLYDVNHRILINKDGSYAWRPLELIHPALYVSLVNRVTQPVDWDLICNRFGGFRANPRIRCLSLPIASLTDQKDIPEQIRLWWNEIEQQSVELALDYTYMIRTDIVDCYSAIYTHSIAWSLHTKHEAKQNKNNGGLIGNTIDRHIQSMSHGQTNGIPQGSVLMDFIAEMVLGYADSKLTRKISDEKIEDYQILRYRDDYRIFVNNPRNGERILKCLTEVMIDLGLKLNPDKTSISDEVVQSSTKDDKLSWMFRRQDDSRDLQTLLIIHDHSLKHPNSGSLVRALSDYYERIIVKPTPHHVPPSSLISIIADISYRNPKTYPISAAILSKLLNFLDTPEAKRLIFNRIKSKFSQIPNTGHMDIWLQRVSYPLDPDVAFDEPLCRLVRGENEQMPVWNSEQIFEELRETIDPQRVVDREELKKLLPVIPIEEVQLFRPSYY